MAEQESTNVVGPRGPVDERPPVFVEPLMHDPVVRGLVAVSKQLDWLAVLFERMYAGIHEDKNAGNPKARPLPPRGGRPVSKDDVFKETLKARLRGEIPQMPGQMSIDEVDGVGKDIAPEARGQGS